jgi:hypothetical protein
MLSEAAPPPAASARIGLAAAESMAHYPAP